MDNFTKWAIVGIALMAAGIFMTAEAAYTPSSEPLAKWDAVSNETNHAHIQGIGAVTTFAGYYIDGAVLVTSAQNDEVGWVFFSPDANPRTLYLRYEKNTNKGIINVLVNDVSAGTVDTYAASVSYNSTSTLTITPATGQNSLRMRMATKNAGSSAFVLAIQDWYIK